MKSKSSYRSWEEAVRHLSIIVNTFLRGRSGQVTLSTSAVTTNVSDSRVGAESKVFLQAITANAASETTATYISNITKEQFTITHANNVIADRVFNYKIEG